MAGAEQDDFCNQGYVSLARHEVLPGLCRDNPV